MEPRYIQRQITNYTSKASRLIARSKIPKGDAHIPFLGSGKPTDAKKYKKKLSSCKNSVSVIKICEYETTVKLRSIPFHVNIEHFPAEF